MPRDQVFQCHVLPSNPSHLDSAAALPPLSLSRLPVRALPGLPIYFFFVFRARPHWNARKQQEEPEEAKNGSDRKGVQKNSDTRKRTSGHRHRGAAAFCSYLFRGFPSQSPVPPI